MQGQVTYVDDSSHQEIAAVGVNVLMYQSVVEYQDHPKNYDKIVTTGPSGYYSLFPLSDGPYYVYAEKLDTAGKVLFSAGSSVNVGGNETKLLNLFMH